MIWASPISPILAAIDACMSARRTLLGGAYGTDRQNFAFGQTGDLPSWNHEVRLSSKPGGKLKWQIGGFYFQEKNNLNTQFQDYPGQQSISGTPFLLQNYVYPDILSKSKAVFGQASYEFLPGVTAEYGMRYSSDQKHRYGYNTVTNLSTYLTTSAGRPIPASLSPLSRIRPTPPPRPRSAATRPPITVRSTIRSRRTTWPM
jgi:hypothetical protein